MADNITEFIKLKMDEANARITESVLASIEELRLVEEMSCISLLSRKKSNRPEEVYSSLDALRSFISDLESCIRVRIKIERE